MEGPVQHELILICTAEFFDRCAAEPQGSASDCQGFRQNRPNLPGTKFATAILGSLHRHFGRCIVFHEQRKHLRKVPLQQKGSKTLMYANAWIQNEHLAINSLDVWSYELIGTKLYLHKLLSTR